MRARHFVTGLLGLRPKPASGLGDTASIPRAKRRRTWPDCDPIDKSDEFWEFNNNLSLNGIPYHKEEVEPGRWQWVINAEALRSKQEEAARRSDLWFALRTRVLTSEEMASVRSYGQWLNLQEMVPYDASQKALELNNALANQALMQIAYAQGIEAPGQDRNGLDPKDESPVPEGNAP
jgi:hypothetical protein